jgi:hypothetical protein
LKGTSFIFSLRSDQGREAAIRWIRIAERLNLKDVTAPLVCLCGKMFWHWNLKVSLIINTAASIDRKRTKGRVNSTLILMVSVWFFALAKIRNEIMQAVKASPHIY